MSARDEAKSKLAEGKQSLKAKQYEEAVELLARALEIMFAFSSPLLR
jgi:flagellin-specific chaperone FliS